MAYSKIIHTKSEAPDVIPQPGSLTFGELAINYYDGKAYIKNTNNIVAKIGDTAYESRIGKLERDAAVAQNTIDTVANVFETSGITQHGVTYNNPHFVTSSQLLKLTAGAIPGDEQSYTLHDLTWVPDDEATLFTSPEFTGIPLAPTADKSVNTTQIATTAFVKTAVADLIGSAPDLLDTLGELAAAMGEEEENFLDFYYTKTELDHATTGKADKSTTYTRTYLDSAINAKADQSTTYTKGETDTLLDTKPSSTDYNNIVKITQTAYDAASFTPDNNTLYIVTP